MVIGSDPARFFPIALLLAATTVVACHIPSAASSPEIVLAAQVGKRDFFEGEPVYVVFSVTNTGSDTAWIAPFHLTAWFLGADIRDTAGALLPEWGPIADFVFPPGYRGAPVPPGRRINDVALVQHRWGINRSDMNDLYMGHHIPPGRYALHARFRHEIPRGGAASNVIYAQAVAFEVHKRTLEQNESFQALQRLAAMPWDSVQRPTFLDALVASVVDRPADDPILPLLVLHFVGTARAVGYPPDSATLDLFASAGIEAAHMQRFTAAGATAVIAVHSYRPMALPALAEQLNGSLAGEVAASLIDRQ